MAAPSKLTPERVQRLVQAVRLGATFRLACLYAGISEDTLARWRRRSPETAAALAEAEGQAALGWLAKIEQAASNGEWTAAAWKLERRYPREYGRRVEEQVGDQHLTIKVLYDEHALDHAPGSPAPPASGSGDPPP